MDRHRDGHIKPAHVCQGEPADRDQVVLIAVSRDNDRGNTRSGVILKIVREEAAWLASDNTDAGAKEKLRLPRQWKLFLVPASYPALKAL